MVTMVIPGRINRNYSSRIAVNALIPLEQEKRGRGVDFQRDGDPRWTLRSRCRANTAHVRQSRPDSGLDF